VRLLLAILFLGIGLAIVCMLTHWDDDRQPLLIEASSFQSQPQIYISPCLVPPGNLRSPRSRKEVERV
jgi:hypothetical protein